MAVGETLSPRIPYSLATLVQMVVLGEGLPMIVGGQQGKVRARGR